MVVAQIEPMLTTDEVAAWLRKHRNQVQAMAQSGELPGAVKIGRTWRFDRAAIARWLRGEEEAQPDENK